MQPQDYMLTKSTEPIAIRKYFEAVLKLEQTSAEQFPIDLDQVWQLAYERKDIAVRALTKSDFFAKGTDYQTFRRNVEAGKHNTTVVEKYFLTVPAMEWFVARRVPAVFEVYRAVFHATAKNLVELPDRPEHIRLLEGTMQQEIGSSMMADGKEYWPYAHIIRMAGYRNCPARLYRWAAREMDAQKLYQNLQPTFRIEYGQIWATADVCDVLVRRRKAWTDYQKAQHAVARLLLQ